MRGFMVGLAAITAMSVSMWDAAAQGPRGGRPSFDRLLEAFDANDDKGLQESEVPAPVWSRLSAADVDGDGLVTRTEFDGYRPQK